MDVGIKPIETPYRGHRFRSRLEARWAVFFDAMKIAWQYELDRYDLNGMSYLPDFFLPELGTWVEVKGDLKSCTDTYLANLVDGSDWGAGLPGVADSWNSTRGLLWLGQTPPIETSQQSVIHPIMQHHKGVILSWSHFTDEGGLFVAPHVECIQGAAIREHLEKYLHGKFVFTDRYSWRVPAAYTIARRARFEHGEEG